MVGGNVGGHIYDRHMCSGKLDSVIPHFNYSKIFRDGWFVISFIHISVKNSKPLQALLEGGRDTYVR